MGTSRSEDGATAVTVAICLLLLVGAGAVAIDLGSAFATKRALVVDTDAAAMAGARALATGTCTDAETEAEAFLGANVGQSVALTSGTDFFCDDGQGTVRVEYVDQAQQTLSPAIRAGELDVFSSSVARMDFGTQGALRPLSTCIDSPMVASMARTDVVFDGSPGTLCSATNGNWGWLCFDDKNCETPNGAEESDGDYQCTNPTSTLGYLRCGYTDPHPQPRLGAAPSPMSSPWTAHDEDCSWGSPNPSTENYSGESPMDWCWTKPGVNVGELATDPLAKFGKDYPKAIDVALDDEVFPILLFDRWRAGADGREVVHPKAYLWIRFHGYCLNPDTYAGSWPASRRHECSGSKFILDIEPLHIQWDDAIPLAVRAALDPNVALCGVDHDPTGTDRC